ncbi:MAG: hypothetical protein AAF713_09360 [Pseudomonadota bacterium]
MKKQSKKPKQAKAQPAAAPTPAAKVPKDRRQMLRSVASWGAVAVALGGVGYWAVGGVRATIAEQDLSRVGNGTPTIVQIHDPQCRECMALQVETRDALAALDSQSLDYVVANIRTAEGRAFAGRHDVSHVTLLLFDGRGALRNVLRGVQPSATLQREFEAHLRASAGS